MKLRIASFLLVSIAGLLVIGLSSARDVTKNAGIGSGTKNAPQAVGRCGITVQLSVTVTEGFAYVTASGQPGASCTWTGLDVLFSMRDASSGEWVPVPGYAGSAQNWDSPGYDCEGYDKYRATAIGHDHPQFAPTGDGSRDRESGAFRAGHRVSTTVQG